MQRQSGACLGRLRPSGSQNWPCGEAIENLVAFWPPARRSRDQITKWRSRRNARISWMSWHRADSGRIRAGGSEQTPLRHGEPKAYVATLDRATIVDFERAEQHERSGSSVEDDGRGNALSGTNWVTGLIRHPRARQPAVRRELEAFSRNPTRGLLVVAWTAPIRKASGSVSFTVGRQAEP